MRVVEFIDLMRSSVVVTAIATISGVYSSHWTSKGACFPWIAGAEPSGPMLYKGQHGGVYYNPGGDGGARDRGWAGIGLATGASRLGLQVRWWRQPGGYANGLINNRNWLAANLTESRLFVAVLAR